MLNNLRRALAPTLDKLGNAAASTGLSPSAWTGLGLVGTLIASLLFGLDIEYAMALGGVVLLVSGFFDIVDGQVARITNKSSKLGAFFDSVSDKVGEVIIFLGILVGGLAAPYLVLIAVSLSLLVSYTRSRAESLGVSLQGVGIGERAERLLIIAIAAIVGGVGHFESAIEYGVIIVCIVAGITLIQRVIRVTRVLRS